MKVLHVWSRIKCKWVVWHGTRAAWLRLPHAVILGCTVAAGTLAAVHIEHMHVSTPVAAPTPIIVPQYVLAGIPKAPQWMPVALGWMPPAYAASAPPSDTTKCDRYRDADSDDCKTTVISSVPEPAPWGIMLAGLAILGLTRKRIKT